MKVMHVTTGLGSGGAEGVLFRLVTGCHPGIEHRIVSLTGDGHYGSHLRRAGVTVDALRERRGILTLGDLKQLRRWVTQFRPDVVQTWMYHANLIGGLVARSAGVRSVVWGIRHANLDPSTLSISANIAARLGAPMSRWLPRKIVCCSVESARAHETMGYRAKRLHLIPNGYDLSRFAVDPRAGTRVRMEWGVGGEDVLIGMVARWHPVKNHANLLCALAMVPPHIRCVLVGTGMEASNAGLTNLLRRYGVEQRVLLAGPRDDIPAVMNALDVHVLASDGEAFPNAVAEAMACGTPCVTTAVGDAPLIVGTVGEVVPVRDSPALARAIVETTARLRQEGPARVGARCRARIERKFSLQSMVSKYVRLWESVQ